MWGVIVLAFAVLAVVASLLLGWPIIVAGLIAVVATGAFGIAAAGRAAREKPAAPATGSSRPRHISEVRDASEAGPSEIPSSGT